MEEKHGSHSNSFHGDSLLSSGQPSIHCGNALRVSLYKGTQVLPHGHVRVHRDTLLCPRKCAPTPQRDRAGPGTPHPEKCSCRLVWPGALCAGGLLGACSPLWVVALHLGQWNCLAGDALGRML